MLVKAIGLTAGGKVGFADLEGHWSRDYIAAAAAKGIVSGYSSVNFAPEDNITRCLLYTSNIGVIPPTAVF